MGKRQHSTSGHIRHAQCCRRQALPAAAPASCCLPALPRPPLQPRLPHPHTSIPRQRCPCPVPEPHRRRWPGDLARPGGLGAAACQAGRRVAEWRKGRVFSHVCFVPRRERGGPRPPPVMGAAGCMTRDFLNIPLGEGGVAGAGDGRCRRERQHSAAEGASPPSLQGFTVHIHCMEQIVSCLSLVQPRPRGPDARGGKDARHAASRQAAPAITGVTAHQRL